MTESPLRCDRPTCRPTETRSLDSRQERRKPRALTTALSTSCMTPRCGKWHAPPLTAYEPQGASGACRDFPISDGALMEILVVGDDVEARGRWFIRMSLCPRTGPVA